MGITLNTFVFVSPKPWHNQLFHSLSNKIEGNWIRIKSVEEFTFDYLNRLKPEWVFIPHWSHIIPASVFENFRCVVFHMTDLPFGRGGSPLQNLIARGVQSTMISAIKVAEGIDTGDVYLKKPLGLGGTAEEIFLRAASVIEEMIVVLIHERPSPQPQTGTAVNFKRRKPSESNIALLDEPDLEKIFDHIRMLDCVEYPQAFLEINGIRFEFSRASLKSDGSIIADVRITKK